MDPQLPVWFFFYLIQLGAPYKFKIHCIHVLLNQLVHIYAAPLGISFADIWSPKEHNNMCSYLLYHADEIRSAHMTHPHAIIE